MIRYRHAKLLFAAVLSALLAACGTTPRAPASSAPNAPAPAATPSDTSRLPALPAAGSGRGGYYQDDGPGEHPPGGLLELPDAIPKVEPYSPTGNKPYVVFGKTYVPITDDRPYKEHGVGSWYGKKFHGQKTSSGEPYDMYKLTAAHPTLPIPSYARVTNLANGKQVIVRINDRGPFRSDRIIDLSYTAALKLGYLSTGSSQLEVERLLPDEIARINAARQSGAPAATVATAPAIAPTIVQVPAQTGEKPMAAAELSPVPVLVPLPPSPASAPTSAPAAAATTGQTAPPAAAPAIGTDTPDLAAGFYLQFGAYTEAGNADAERARLQQNWDSALPPLEVYSVGLFYRLHSGPFATREEAQAAAQRLLSMGNVKALVVEH